MLLPAASQQRPQQVAPDQGSMGNGTDSSSSGSDGAVPGRRPGANAPGQLTPETNGSVIEQLVRAYDERVEQARQEQLKLEARSFAEEEDAFADAFAGDC